MRGSLSSAWPALMDRRSRRRSWRRFASHGSHAQPEGWLPGEVGCFLSHFEIWRRIASGNEPWAAVFEDDLRVSTDLGRLLRSHDWIPSDADIVRLEANRSMRLSDGRGDRCGVRPQGLSRALRHVGRRWLRHRQTRRRVADRNSAGSPLRRRSSSSSSQRCRASRESSAAIRSCRRCAFRTRYSRAAMYSSKA